MLAWKEGDTIAIWGTGFWGNRLYYKYRGRYQVSCFIDNSPKFDILDGISVITADKMNKLNCKILIAVQKYECICNQCEESGKRFYSDYLPYIFFEYQQIPIIPLYSLVKNKTKKYFYLLLQDKKSALMIGNCQTSNIKPSMEGSKQFAEEYLFIDIPMVHLLKRYDIEVLQRCSFIFKESDLIITQHVSNKAGAILGTENILNMKGENTKIVYIPNLWFDCYYPQAAHQYKRIDLGNGTCAFPYADCVIDELIKKYSIDDVIKIVKSENLYSERFLEDLYEYRVSELTQREKSWDIKILDFIMAYWKEELLFYSTNHPANHIIFEETDRLLRFLGYGDFESERVCISELSGFQEIIYPSVKLNYGLKFEHDFYKDGCFEGKKTIEEYIREYISYIHPYQSKKYYLLSKDERVNG